MEPLIMIVDDDSDVREFLEVLISISVRRESPQRAELIACRNGHEALDSLNLLQPERKICLISDIDMPGMNGIELMELMQYRLGERLAVKAIHSGRLAHHPEAAASGAILISKTDRDRNEVIKNLVRTFLQATAA